MKSILAKVSALAVASGMMMSSQAQAGTNTLCVFDILGTQGSVFSMMQDYKLQAAKWGDTLVLKPYTDERIAAEDFKAGQCDGVVLTGLRARQFDSFTGSIDSVGAVVSYDQLREAIDYLAKPSMAKYMVKNGFEVAGISPMGAAYLFVNDRSINNVSKLAGKRIGVLDYDKAQAKLVQQVGAQPVASDITNFAGKFNNGSVDIVAAPAVAFKPLELYKGLGTRGAIPNFPLAQLTVQIVIRPEKFPANFGQKSREYVASRYDSSLALIKRAEAGIDPKYWMELPAADKQKYIAMLRQSRIALTKDGIYDKQSMHFLKVLRCHDTPSAAECSENLE